MEKCFSKIVPGVIKSSDLLGLCLFSLPTVRVHLQAMRLESLPPESEQSGTAATPLLHSLLFAHLPNKVLPNSRNCEARYS